jgi:hypothetical protein
MRLPRRDGAREHHNAYRDQKDRHEPPGFDDRQRGRSGLAGLVLGSRSLSI